MDDIQLFGTAKQVAAAQEFARNMAQQHREASLDELLADLRSGLRKELKLDPLEGNRVFLRFSKDEVQSGDGAKAV